jgi:hypothetical protein
MRLEPSDAAMNDCVGVGIGGIDAEGLREAGAVGRLDRGEAESHSRVTASQRNAI